MSVSGGNYQASTVALASQIYDAVMPGTLAVASHGTNTQTFTLPASVAVQFAGNFPILALATRSDVALQSQLSWQNAASLNGCSIQDVTVSGSTLTVTFSNPTGSSITIPVTLRLVFLQIAGS